MPRRLVLALVVALGLQGCSILNGPTSERVSSSDAAVSQPEMSPMPDGPKAPENRPLADMHSVDNAAGTARIIEVDFGNVSAGEFRAPLRGLVITPTQANAPTPLVVVSHLRAPNCMDDSFSYPCAPGVSELRFDRGMSYLGEHLAERGFTVVIPDLGGVFIGSGIQDPYDQNTMWKNVVGRFIEALKEDSEHSGVKNFGFEFPQPVDFGSVGLVLHSRSGMMVQPAIELFGQESIKSVFAYGPSYDTFELDTVTAAPADIPYLAVVGEDDHDVGPSANLWIGHYLSQPRATSAAVVSLPGLGHMFVNRAASEAGKDDRIGCEERGCLDAAEHERVMSSLASDWLQATMTGADSELPVSSNQPLPTEVAGIPARWLAHTQKAVAQVTAEDFYGATEGASKICINPDPMNPTPIENACPMPELGVVQILTPVNYLIDAAADINVSGARGMAVHMSPSGSYKSPGTAVTVALQLQDGREFSHEISDRDPVLINRNTVDENGTYVLGTVRVPLPEWVGEGVISNLRITSAGDPVELRGVDFWG